MDLDEPAKVVFRVLAVGDVLVDEFLGLPETSEFLDSKKKIFCFPYGQKIEIGGVAYSVGGNAANVAVGLCRLGIRTTLWSTIGDDWTAKMILDAMAAERVGTFTIESSKGSVGGRGIVINYAGERTIFSFHPSLGYRVPAQIPSVEWVFLTSMGRGYGETYRAVVEWKKSGGSGRRMAFNPGTWQLNEGAEKWQDVLTVADILLVNREEAMRICKVGGETEVKELMQELLAMGPKIVVVTDGTGGAYAATGEKSFWCPIYKVEEVERTGMGDAFGTGFVAAIMEGREMAEAMKWGTVEAAAVALKVGAETGLLTKEEMPEALVKAAEVKAVAI